MMLHGVLYVACVVLVCLVFKMLDVCLCAWGGHCVMLYVMFCALVCVMFSVLVCLCVWRCLVCLLMCVTVVFVCCVWVCVLFVKIL